MRIGARELLQPFQEYEFTPYDPDIDTTYLAIFMGYEKIGGVTFLRLKLKGYPFLLNPAHVISIFLRSDSIKLGEDQEV